MNYKEVIQRIKSLRDPEAVKGMARFGINPKNTYGVSLPYLRKMAKQISKNHLLAQSLWSSGIHEARILACLIDDPAEVTEGQMEKWVKDFDSWDICDQCCSNLFDKTNYSYKKAIEWAHQDKEFIRRAGFVMMAVLAVHDKKAPNKVFIQFFSLIQRGAEDERNFVKKAVTWALRQIGKRNHALNKNAIAIAKKIQRMNSKSARWIASDALRELTSEAVRKRMKR
jgi:3-methyladenine DNA glycosylase AlkD